MKPQSGPPAPAGLSLEIRDLRIAFEDGSGATRIVLDVPELSVAGAAQVALCGPSGSGKTTFLDVIAGLQRPQRGQARWSAIEITALDEHRLDRWRWETVGLVFQQFHLFDGLNALENVLLPLRFARGPIEPATRHRALDLLDRVGVKAYASMATVSRGEMQRVAVVRALLRGPAIVLADEPTASLDRDAGKTVTDLLCTLCREAAATLIVTTHDYGLAERLDEVHEIGDCRLRRRLGRGALVNIASVA